MINTKIIGKLINVFPIETYGDFKKRVFWVEEIKDKNRQTWAIELWGPRINDVLDFKPERVVLCEIEVIGKRWSKNGKESVIIILKCALIRFATQEEILAISTNKNSINKSNSSEIQY